MLICQHNAEFGQATGEEEDCDWSLAARAYKELREMPSYIAQQRQEFVATTTAHASHLQGKQLLAYTAVRDHSESSDPNRPPLRMVVSGTAGTGKSYLIQCLKLLLKDRLCVAAPTGVAAFNVDGYTLHSLLSLPVKGDFKPLKESAYRPFSRCCQWTAHCCSECSSHGSIKGYIGRCRWTGACYLHCTRCSGDALCQLVGGSVFGQRCSRNC